MDGNQASSKDKQVQVDEMKEMCFFLSANQNSYSFLLKKLRDRDNMGRDEYPITATLALDILIRTECVIRRNQQLSTYEKWEGRGGHQHK